MKSVRIIFLVLVLALALPMASVSAQEDEGELEPVISAVYYIPATGGSFVTAAEGDGYVLTLTDVAPEVAWIMNEPSLILQQHDTANLAAQWGLAADLMSKAVLEIDGWNILVMLGSPTYADGTLTFMAYDPEIVAPGIKEPELPESFGRAAVTILWTLDFQQTMITAVFESEGIRATSEECAAWKAQWDIYWAWFLPKQSELSSALLQCKFTKDPNACQKVTEINAEIATEYAKVSHLPDLLNQECGGFSPN
ncbi:MAG: hypothetical protein JXA10_08200 [Anaerolineae bacterium]|nr:hypothetical protein [Anaerolineae bacterium]